MKSNCSLTTRSATIFTLSISCIHLPIRFTCGNSTLSDTEIQLYPIFKKWLFKDIFVFLIHSFPPLCSTNLAKQPEVSQYNYRTSLPVTSSRATLAKEQEKFGKVPFDYASFDAQVFGKRTTAPVAQGRKTPQFLECKLEFPLSLGKWTKFQ